MQTGSEALRIPLATEELTLVSEFTTKRRAMKGRGGRIAALLLLMVAGGLAFAYRHAWLPAPPVVTTPAPPPALEPLTAEMVQSAVDGEQSRLLACYRSGRRRFRRIEKLRATLEIASTGGVATVLVDPPVPTLGAPGPCIEEVLRALRFRTHPDPLFKADVDLPSPQSGAAPEPKKRSSLTSEIQEKLQGSSAALTKCLGGLTGVPNAPSLVNATVTISSSGKVTNVGLDPEVPVASVADCLRQNFRAYKFRNRPGKDVKVTIPLKIRLL